MDIVTVIIIASILALAPTLVYALLVWWLDRHEKEPWPLLVVAFMWGAVPAVILALILEIAVGFPLESILVTDQAREVTTASLVAPIVEECVKAVILVVLFLAYRREFDNVLDGVVYGAMVGLGFACVENVLYLVSTAYEGVPDGGSPLIGNMFSLWVFRAGLFGLNHSMFTAFTGAALGLARSLKLRWQRGAVPALGLGAAMIFHGIHNYLASVLGTLGPDEQTADRVLGTCLTIIISDYGGILFIIVVAFVSGVHESRIIRETLAEEVSLGRFTQDEYDTLTSGLRRWTLRWSVLFSSGPKRWRQLGRFFDLATELAFRKHRMHDGDPIHQNISARDVAQLRQRIDEQKAAILA
ncbi:MAG: PrsW family intramembrane metalloprotease [Chloroflexia bacterium]